MMNRKCNKVSRMRMRVGGMMILYGLMAICAAVQVSCNEYTCNNGTAQRGFPSASSVFCVACDSGYRLVDNSCQRQGAYTCDNGTATAGNPPGTSAVAQCARCDDGHHLEGITCVANTYTCDKGDKAADGTPGGVADGGELCASCIDGYHIEGNECAINEYMCANGIKMDDGTPGGVHNGQFCASCNVTDPTHFLQTDNSCHTIPGSGTMTDPYQLDTYEELDTIRNDLDAHYALTGDIDATPSWSAGAAGCDPYDGSNGDDSNVCAGWVPVGPFTGSLDGRGNTISNLYINRSSSNTGMFSRVGQGSGSNMGIIRALRLESLFARGQGSTGGLVGTLDTSGIITDCSVAGDIFNTGFVYTGGLVGRSFGATITHSFASGSVSSTSRNTGGLIGIAENTAVSSSYATNSVRGTIVVGGLVGEHREANSRITTSYSTGMVSSTADTPEFIGGLVGGIAQNATVSNSFWDKDTSGQDTSAGGTGLTTADMQATSGAIRDGLGIDNWLFEADSYPRLCADDDGNAPCEDKPGVILPGQ